MFDKTQAMIMPHTTNPLSKQRQKHQGRMDKQISSKSHAYRLEGQNTSGVSLSESRCYPSTCSISICWSPITNKWMPSWMQLPPLRKYIPFETLVFRVIQRSTRPDGRQSAGSTVEGGAEGPLKASSSESTSAWRKNIEHGCIHQHWMGLCYLLLVHVKSCKW